MATKYKIRENERTEGYEIKDSNGRIIKTMPYHTPLVSIAAYFRPKVSGVGEIDMSGLDSRKNAVLSALLKSK